MLKNKLQKMLGSGFEIKNNNYYTQFPLTINTPFIDTLGDNIIIYVEKRQQQYRFTDGGYLCDDFIIKKLNKSTKTNKLLNYYGTKIQKDEFISDWFNKTDLINPLNFYAYLQSILELISL